MDINNFKDVLIENVSDFYSNNSLEILDVNVSLKKENNNRHILKFNNSVNIPGWDKLEVQFIFIYDYSTKHINSTLFLNSFYDDYFIFDNEKKIYQDILKEQFNFLFESFLNLKEIRILKAVNNLTYNFTNFIYDFLIDREKFKREISKMPIFNE